jgi:hypothetical protein
MMWNFKFLSDILEVVVMLLKAITDADPSTVIVPTLPASVWLCGEEDMKDAYSGAQLTCTLITTPQTGHKPILHRAHPSCAFSSYALTILDSVASYP